MRIKRKYRGFPLSSAHGVIGFLCALATAPTALAQVQTQLPTTINDFFHPGTQPNTLVDVIQPSNNCRGCHGQYDDFTDNEPWDGWVASMMGQSARDPVWHAALAIANQDAANAGFFCIRCHSPQAWLEGRAMPADMSAFIPTDFDGVTCHACHRLVDPVADLENPFSDTGILAALPFPPQHAGNAGYVIDPIDVRRGPFDDILWNMHEPAPILHSPHHREARLCGACHDVSNPAYTRQPDGTYALNAVDAAHPDPTTDPHEMMPEQRTYSEWLHSDFANAGVVFPDGRFGSTIPGGLVQSCQDCHMPPTNGGGCVFWAIPPLFPRTDLPQHTFAGVNSWVLQAVFDEHGSAITGLTQPRVDAARARAVNMLQNASDLMVRRIGSELEVRIVNFSGHKLPTGYPEGRRIWVNVKFFDAANALLTEHGGYNPTTATLDEATTKVYAMHLGIDAATASASGLAEGPTFHLVLNNVILEDNRIPPMGFTNAAFESIRSQPVNYAYADGQYWDDTRFTIPQGAVRAEARLFHQTSTREYIEFLRDANTTNTAGQALHNAWVATGKSAPVNMDFSDFNLATAIIGDTNGNGVVNIDDLVAVLNAFGLCPPPAFCPEDFNGNGVVNIDDLVTLLNNFG